MVFLNIATYRPVNISIIGEVKNPGAYTLENKEKEVKKDLVKTKIENMSEQEKTEILSESLNENQN